MAEVREGVGEGGKMHSLGNRRGAGREGRGRRGWVGVWATGWGGRGRKGEGGKEVKREKWRRKRVKMLKVVGEGEEGKVKWGTTVLGEGRGTGG